MEKTWETKRPRKGKKKNQSINPLWLKGVTKGTPRGENVKTKSKKQREKGPRNTHKVKERNERKRVPRKESVGIKPQTELTASKMGAIVVFCGFLGVL